MTGPGVRMPSSGEDQDALKRTLRRRLTSTRDKTLDLLGTLSDEHLYTQPEPVMGVIAWDLGHMGMFEERWLVAAPRGDGFDEDESRLFDPEDHPRSERGQLELPSRKQLRRYLENVREDALKELEGTDLSRPDPLTKDGFVHDMVVRHEDQHRENMLITLTLFPPKPDHDQQGTDPAPAPPVPDLHREPKPTGQALVDGMVRFPETTFTLGQERKVGTYDNEWPPHEVHLDAFEIDVAPVTNAEYLRFIEDGGYEDPDPWTRDGWLIREALDLEHPKHWTREGEDWFIQEGSHRFRLPLDQPVMHVSYHEAQAYANWAGKRLPTEAEWEAAASLDPETGTKHRFPWGNEAWTPRKANLGQRTHGPAPVGSYPEGASPAGCHQMTGDMWEWTSTTFTGYPGFEAFPYQAYSKPHMDRGFKVLRGGSWATEPSCAHTTFRNWHQPDHQHIFAGFRCARKLSS